MEEFMNIMKLKVKSLELSPDKVNLISEKDCYIGAFLLGFIEYLQNIKVDSLVQFAEKLEKEIFNKKIIEELINAQIILMKFNILLKNTLHKKIRRKKFPLF